MKKIDIRQINSYQDIERVLMNDDLILVYENTKYLNESSLSRFMDIQSRSKNKLRFELVSCFDDRCRRYNEENIMNCPEEDVIYSVNELIEITKVITDIESGINKEWDEMQKLIYFINRLKNSIIYHPFHEIQPSKDIRSLRGLVSGKTVCAGYAMILKELCDRNGIKCHYALGTTLDHNTHTKKELSGRYHAWNIVEINGNLIPVDLTWNAGKSNKGKTLSVEDIGNVNEFVKHHFPMYYESIKDYSKLKNIDGSYLRNLSQLVSKEVVFKNTSFNVTRSDKTKFKITQVREFLIEGQICYKYIYQEYDKDNKLNDPIILYSNTNVSTLVSFINNRNKKIKQLNDLKNKNNKTQKDYDDMKELENVIKNTEHLIDGRDKVVKLLFSRENIQAAKQRGDYFLGKVDNVSEDKKSHNYKVFVDPSFGKKIPFNQRTMKRSDGSTFVIEDYPYKNNYTNRYTIYEPIDGVVKRNTILTNASENLMTDNRRDIPDYFLERKRITRKNIESGGYLGYLGNDGLKHVDDNASKYYSSDIFKRFKFDSSKVHNYYGDITFEEMERLAKTYKFEGLSAKDIVNRRTGVKLDDPVLKLKAQFANLWLYAAGAKYLGKEEINGFTYAFSDQAKRAFEVIDKYISESMNKNGNIDIPTLYDNIESVNYKYATEIVFKLFRGQWSEVINQLYRLQNPSSMPIVKPEIYNSESQLSSQLSRRKQELEEMKRQLLEVQELYGQVSVVHKSR